MRFPEEDAGGLPELVAEINITPLTDVFLVLLIISMVSSTAMVNAARQGQLEVALPAAQTPAPGPRDAPTLIIGVLEDGRPFVDGQATDSAGLQPLLQRAFGRNPATVVIVDADGGVAHRHVVAVIDQVKAAGFASVALGAQATAP